MSKFDAKMIEMLNNSADERYVLSEIEGWAEKDNSVVASWIVTARALFPYNFDLQYDGYKDEKHKRNHKAAARILNHLLKVFEKQYFMLKVEIEEVSSTLLSAVLSGIEYNVNFYERMFEFLCPEVQMKVISLSLTEYKNRACECDVLFSILRRYPSTIVIHGPRLLQMIDNGRRISPQKFHEFLMDEILPFYKYRLLPVSSWHICGIFRITLEYYVKQIAEIQKNNSIDIWKKIFNILTICSQILRWQSFEPFRNIWEKNNYWVKLYDVITKGPSGSPHILYFTTTLFLYSLHCYIRRCNTSLNEHLINYILVEGYSSLNLKPADRKITEPPEITVTTSTSKELSKAFVHAAQCWQLLNTEQFHSAFSKLLVKLPLSSWISRFLFDFAMYFGHAEEAKSLMDEMTITSPLIYSILKLTIDLLQNSFSAEGLQWIVKILLNLPKPRGHLLTRLSLHLPRHMLFMPITYKTLIQYCTRAIIINLKAKFYGDESNDQVMGSLLILLQLSYRQERHIVEDILSKITAQQSFNFPHCGTYIVHVDLIEELTYLRNCFTENKFIISGNTKSTSSDINIKSNSASCTSTGSENSKTSSTSLSKKASSSSTTALGSSTRRTRSSHHERNSSNHREDVCLIYKQQMQRCNQSVYSVIANFIIQEHAYLTNVLFETQPSINGDKTV